MALAWNRRFFASTRGQVIGLLRRGRRTVEELAQALGLTDNAVRAHLASLERDGLVRQEGLRRGPSRPAYAYELTLDAERLFPKPYGAVLRVLLDVLAEEVPPTKIESMLREVGHRMAAGQPPPAGDLQTRVDRGVALLADLGGLAESEDADEGILIKGYSCPLGDAVPGHPEICRLAETLLVDAIGNPVHEQCDRGATPRCRFLVPTALQ
ncbi:MAG: hypothetical protein QOG89_1270, partial [Thermomicrobiales bacterium]|nr:hypothetical protein [Thermomicrobiales bacterium]